VGLNPRFVLIKTMREKTNRKLKQTSQKGHQKLFTSHPQAQPWPTVAGGSPSGLRLVGIARAGLQLEVGGAMGEAHGAVGWAPDEVLLEQTLEVLRASQSHSNETQADVQQVGAPAHTPTRMHTHARAAPRHTYGQPKHTDASCYSRVCISAFIVVRCWASECDVALWWCARNSKTCVLRHAVRGVL